MALGRRLPLASQQWVCLVRMALVDDADLWDVGFKQ
jgi:hypothetical protein